MTGLEAYGLAADALLALAFWFVRGAARFAACGAAIVAACAGGAFAASAGRLDEWALMTAGLLATALGLLILRVMLVRSVSLHLLGRAGGLHDADYAGDIQRRLLDLQSGGMVRRGLDERFALTSAGRATAALLAVLYAVLRLDR